MFIWHISMAPELAQLSILKNGSSKRSVVCNQLLSLRVSFVLLVWRKLKVINNGATKQKHHKQRGSTAHNHSCGHTSAGANRRKTMMGKSSRNNPAAHHGHLPVLQCLHSSQTINAAINRPLFHIW